MLIFAFFILMPNGRRFTCYSDSVWETIFIVWNNIIGKEELIIVETFKYVITFTFYVIRRLDYIIIVINLILLFCFNIKKSKNRLFLVALLSESITHIKIDITGCHSNTVYYEGQFGVLWHNFW